MRGLPEGNVAYSKAVLLARSLSLVGGGFPSYFVSEKKVTDAAAEKQHEVFSNSAGSAEWTDVRLPTFRATCCRVAFTGSIVILLTGCFGFVFHHYCTR